MVKVFKKGPSKICGRQPLKMSSDIPADTGRKLNVHKTFRRRPERLRTSYVCSICVMCLRGWSTRADHISL